MRLSTAFLPKPAPLYYGTVNREAFYRPIKCGLQNLRVYRLLKLAGEAEHLGIVGGSGGIFTPAAPAKAALLVFFHGGGWVS